MQFFKTLFFILLFGLMIIGCQGNNSDLMDSNSSSSNNSNGNDNSKFLVQAITIVLPVKTKELTQSQQIVNIVVKVFDSRNNPYQGGNVKIIYPDDVKNGRDIGYFKSSTVAVKDGVANFVYTGPSDLAVDKNPINFSFYLENNPSKIKDYKFTLHPAVNQKIVASYTLMSAVEKNRVMGLNEMQSLFYYIEDDKGKKISGDDIVSINIELMNPFLGTLSNQNSSNESSLIFTKQNNVTVSLKTNTVSGLLPVKVSAVVIDTNGKKQSIQKVFNILILSGPPTAISMSYVSTTQDEANAKFIDTWVATVTDKYNNLVNTTPLVSMGMLAGYAKSSSPTDNIENYLYYNPKTATNKASGIISAKGGNSNVASFSATNTPFANVDDTNDYLVTFGNGYTYNASGKWTIQYDSNKTLSLIDEFNNSKNISNLGFSVGHNYRQDRCVFGEEWVGNVYPTNGIYKINKNGIIKMNVSYDYYFVGKDVMLWMNVIGNSNRVTERIGESKKVTLRGNGLAGDSYSFVAGGIGVQRLFVTINNTVEYYKNANFWYAVTITGDGNKYDVIGTSMDQNITSCVDGKAKGTGGMAYVDVNITDANTSGTISLTNVIPANEF